MGGGWGWGCLATLGGVSLHYLLADDDVGSAQEGVPYLLICVTSPFSSQVYR